MIRRMRAIGLVVCVTWFWASGTAEALNNTVGTAVQAVLGEKQSQTFTSGAVGYYGYYLYPNRSYLAFCWPASLESGGTISDACSVDLRNNVDAVVASGVGSIFVEPFPKAGKVSAFTPAGDSLYFARVVSTTMVASVTINLIVIETTIASPWYFVSTPAGYEAFVEIRNQSFGATTVTVRAYNATGTIVGSLTTSVPANGNLALRVGADLGAPNGSGSVTITHNGMPGTIVANTTTLSGATGLSFDSPFTPRMMWSMF